MKLKNILIALMMVIGTTLMAQDKYEQAIVSQWIERSSNSLIVSIEGKTFTKTVLKQSALELVDYTPLLNQIALMRNEGWEVWNSAVSINGFSYFLRRKLK